MKLEGLLKKAAEKEKQIVAVASAEDNEVIEAISYAIKYDLAQFKLFGNKEIIEKLLDKHGLISNDIQIVEALTNEIAAESAVRAVREKEAAVLMKGNIPSSTLLKAVLNKNYGLRGEGILSHVAVFEIPGFAQLTILTDAAINIEPDLRQKEQIVKNAVYIARQIGINNPKVAALAAVETINPAMQATVDAASLTLMNRRGQIKNCLLDGPLALDNAVSFEAAKHKQINSKVAGQADILLVPTIDVGNALYKSLIYFAQAKVGAVIAGAKAPIVLTSRSDSSESKLYSLALAICSSEK